MEAIRSVQPAPKCPECRKSEIMYIFLLRCSPCEPRWTSNRISAQRCGLNGLSTIVEDDSERPVWLMKRVWRQGGVTWGQLRAKSEPSQSEVRAKEDRGRKCSLGGPPRGIRFERLPRYPAETYITGNRPFDRRRCGTPAAATQTGEMNRRF
jgi:hypothetical protein